MNSAYRRACGQVAGELTALAERGASGTVRLGGGTLYLSDGYLAFAESAAAPDLGSRLVNSRRLLVHQWNQARPGSQPDVCAGDLLVRRALIDPPEWQTLVRSATLDALVTLAMQVAEDAEGAKPSFTSQHTVVAGPVPCLDIGPAWAYATGEAERLADHQVLPGTQPRLRAADRPWPAFGREARTVLAQINGRATIRDLAWRNGLALYGLMDWVLRLIQDSVCTIGRDAQDVAGVQWTPPEPDILRRVLAGLKRLDSLPSSMPG